MNEDERDTDGCGRGGADGGDRAHEGGVPQKHDHQDAHEVVGQHLRLLDPVPMGRSGVQVFGLGSVPLPFQLEVEQLATPADGGEA